MADLSDLPEDYEDLRRKLMWRGPANDGDRFLSVFMDQNNKCNLKCQMCGFSDARVGAVPKYDMPRALFNKIAAELFPHANYVCLSIMTEPFMTRDFPDRLSLVKWHGVPFSDIITNGTLLNESTIRKIFEADITRFIISIDGGTKEIFETIRRGARFETVIGNLRLVQRMRNAAGRSLPQLRINHVLSEPNIDRFEEFLALVESLHPEEISVRTVSRMSNALIQETTDPAFWRKVRAARIALGEFCRRTQIKDSGFLRDRPGRIELFDDAGEKLICRAPWYTLAIHANGDVYPCMAWTRPPVGNLLRHTFADIWYGSDLASLRREFESVKPGLDCLNCVVRRDLPRERYDDFFYEKVAKQIPPPPTRLRSIGAAIRRLASGAT